MNLILVDEHQMIVGQVIIPNLAKIIINRVVDLKTLTASMMMHHFNN